MSEGQEVSIEGQGAVKTWLTIDKSNMWLTGTQLQPELPAPALTFSELGLSPW